MVKALEQCQKAIIRCLTISPRTENQLCVQLKEFDYEAVHTSLKALISAQTITCTNKRFWIRGLVRQSLLKAMNDRERDYVQTYKR